MKDFSDKTTAILYYVRGREERGELPPTNRDIRDALGISSTSVVDYHIRKLVRDGKLRREHGIARAIRTVASEARRSDILFKIDLDWIPPAETRGNTREHHIALWKEREAILDRAIIYGRAAQDEYPNNEYPLLGDLAIEITAYNPTRIDWDNLTYGYKALIDGLQRVIRCDKLGFEVHGAGLIHNDRQITDATIRARIGDERTEIIFKRAE